MPHSPETLAVHAGQEQADPATNARAVPIYQTTSYVFNDTEHAANLFSLAEPGNIYTRIMNPTQSVFEDRVNQLEGGVGALATASGSAATTYAVLNLCYAGDNIVALSTLYGGTYALFAHTLPQFGIEVRFVDPEKPEELAQHVDEKTKMVFGETIGNPKINVIDLPAWSEAAHAQGLPLVIDNTTPSPYLVRAIEQGADVIVHAATKYIGGHGTSIGGVIVDSGKFDWAAHSERFPGLTKPDPAYHGAVWTEAAGPAAYIIRARTVLLRNTGAAITPMNSWLFLQGLETLHLRMERHSENALAVAKYLESHDAVSWVSYPGLESSPYKEVADRTFTGKGYGGLVSFGLKAGRDGGRSFIESLELFSHLANIGDAKSLAIHNATTTHSQLTPEELVAAGVPEDMVRLSIGIEHVDDIIADLEQALTATK
ncbi:bifunctional O-acetylhomoserine aminocarboxypropyltransferase/cysteine synthase [Nocardioides sp. zg-579]|uniref:Bifunctional O-acetylhomoserine aminocarboxypropyltransferase/cysteine synthase n=1 Tax=Nocardioides marmotae TaxID=2663857 RepID=A0A6I3JDL4_9ACTN|nr:O-acetylhomoserine aminocarboxypropyltransferase/cysteine synthase family protein [Nocardioides marmotae]MCR6032558.1 bifunctional O-acetylhomoserine aminocarboxypropyltransferase/cysteine synthase [Gordonia jinghuaiqii]MTB96207.1 bifunctional O-acetylhomoserine aminocarboxypropyltransferase/cysteine synthase [Nocardioides marmotae]QKD99721.1 O-acetylhomoserine aminocarboxypropyltransferase/cysteine synthase [Nocardioides marmotae]